MEIRSYTRTRTTKTVTVKGNWTNSSPKMQAEAQLAALRHAHETRSSLFNLSVSVDHTGDTVYTMHTD